MPERAEVIHIAACLHEALAGQIVNVLEGVNKAEGLTTPTQCLGVRTRGKKIILLTQTGNILFSLGLSAGFTFTRPARYDLEISTPNRTVWFTKSARGGKIQVLDDSDLELALAKIGPEALDVTLDQWTTLLNTRTRICTRLADQHIVAGIGNYLRAEILYMARIHPTRPCNSLSLDERVGLRDAVQAVITAAIHGQGFTLGTYKDPLGREGAYVPLVYGRHADKDGNPVNTLIVGKRKIYWVPAIQK